ncbi:MAG: DNA adenine methylase [Magnetococcales bacterium]|nr:DNA adenine methylase [Magnetococcales bacterium]
MDINQIKSPLAGWMGGKRLLAKKIVPLIPEHTCYIEPFAGAAWILFSKPPAKQEDLNDINRDVVNLYRVVRHHWSAFVDAIQWFVTSRAEFERFLDVSPENLTDIQRAVRFYYIHKLSFGGRMTGKRTFGYSATEPSNFNPDRIRQDMEAAHRRLARVTVEHLPYADVIQRYDRPSTFFYLDPPYWGVEGYYGKGIFSRADYARLASLLGNTSGKWLMSLNDIPGVRDTFRMFRIENISTRYSCSKGVRTQAQEVLIRNY